MMAAAQEKPRVRALLFNNVPNSRDVQKSFTDKLWRMFGIEVVRVCAPDRGVNFARDPTVDLYIACIGAMGHPQFGLLQILAKQHEVPLVPLDRQTSGWSKALRMEPLPVEVQQVLLEVVAPRKSRQEAVVVPLAVPEKAPVDKELEVLFEEENATLKKKVQELIKKRELQAGTMAAQTKTIKKLEAQLAQGGAPEGDNQPELEKRRAIITEREARIRELVGDIADLEKSKRELTHRLQTNPGQAELAAKTTQIRELLTRIQAADAEITRLKTITRHIQDRAREHFTGVTAADAHLTKMLVSLKNNVDEGILTSEEALDRLMKKMIKETP